MTDDKREDSAIVARVLQGETQLFAVLVQRYERLIYSFLLPQVKSFQEVQDISQEAFIKAYRHLSSFDVQRRFSAWILKIARNLLIDRYRKPADTLGTESTSVQEIIGKKDTQGSEDEPSRKIEVQEEFRRTFVNILQLPEEMKVPLLLRILQELSYEEISEILDVPVQTVKNRIFRARKALKEKRNSENAL